MKSIPLKFVAKIAYGLGQPPREAADGVPVLRATNIYRGSIIRDGLMRADPTDVPWERCPPLAAGEILVVRSGAYTGDSALVTAEWEGAAPGYDLRVTPTGVDPRYLAYVLLSATARDYLYECQSRAAQPHLNADQLGNLRVPAMDAMDQRAIADFLDTETARIDALFSNAGRMKLLGVERLDREISHIVIDQSVAPRRLRQVVDGIEVGVVVQPAALYAPSGIPFLRGVNIRRGALVLDDLKYLDPAKESVAVKSRLRTGDVVVVRTGQAGAAVSVPPELHGANCVDLLIVRPGRGLVSQYLELLLNSEFVRSQVATLTVGSIQSHFNVEALRNTAIPVPVVAAQREIVARANEVRGHHERLLDAIDRQMALLGERRRALITAAVTGRLRVPVTDVENIAV